MNSFRTQEESLAVLAAYPDLAVDGLPLDFVQNNEPKLRADDLGPVDWPDDPELEWCPPGHGDVYVALQTSGLLDTLRDGATATRSCPTPTTSGRRATGRARLDGARRHPVRHRGVRPHPQRPQGRPPRRPPVRRAARAARQRDGGRGRGPLLPGHRSGIPGSTRTTSGSTSTPSHARLAERDGDLGLPIIVNRKTVDPTRADSTPVIQVESAMGAAVEVFEGSRALAVDRSRFRPVKTTNELLLLRSDVYRLTDDYLVASTIDHEEPFIDLVVAVQVRRRLRRALPEGRAVRARLLEPARRGGRDVRCRGRVHGRRPGDRRRALHPRRRAPRGRRVMRTLEEHRAAVLALVAPLPPVRVPVGEALGLVLAEDVVAAVDLPGFDNSAMDGYAVRAAELAGATPERPVVLPVGGDVAAGDTRRHVLAPAQRHADHDRRTAAPGADAVVPVELTDGGADVVALHLEPLPGRHLRHRGEDVRAGDVVLRSRGPARAGPPRARRGGQRRPRCSCGPARGSPSSRPATSSSRPGATLEHGQIVDSNHVMLRALVEAAGRGGGRRRAPARRRRCRPRARRGAARLARPRHHERRGVDGRPRHRQGGAVGAGRRASSSRWRCARGCRRAAGGSAATGRRSSPCRATRSARSPPSTSSSCRPCGGSPARPGRRRLVPRAVADAGWPAVPGQGGVDRGSSETEGRVRPSGGQGSHVLGALAGADGPRARAGRGRAGRARGPAAVPPPARAGPPP